LRKCKEIAVHTEKKRLAPLNEGGPAQLLNIQIQKLEEENQDLRNRLKTVSSCFIEIQKLEEETKTSGTG
jgi:hypothetical protein